MASMISRLASGLAAATAIAALGFAPTGAADDLDAAAAVELPADLLADAPRRWELLGDYCVECHNFEDWAGGVAFDVMAAEEIPENVEVWEDAVRKLRGGLMPPPGEPKPDAQTTDALVAWLEAALDHVGAEAPRPRAVALHRLNRAEYANAVRDLLALEVDPAALLPKDDIVDGFDNIADALQVSPSYLEQYIAAADIVAGLAVGEPRPRAEGATFFIQNGAQHFHVEGLPLGTRGGAVVEHVFPADGDYLVSLNDMATGYYVYGMEYEQTLIVTLDGEKVYETQIGGETDLRSIDQFQTPAVTSINARLKNIPLRVTAGPHEIGVAFVARTFAESDANLHSYVPGGGQDRVLAVSTIDVRGPFDPTGLSETPSRSKIFQCRPASSADEDPCAEQILTSIAAQAFRRPATAEDLAGAMAIYAAEKAKGGFEAGVRGGLAAILASPRFLYRAETPPPDVKPGEVYALSDLELASRLSFFLWSSLPDQELVDLAAAGELSKSDVLEAQVRRMLADPRSESLTTNFAFQWLRVNVIDSMEPDTSIFPYYDASLKAAFREEMRLFVDSVFRENRSVMDLLGADYTFVNERLALHYGINDVRGDRFRRVQLADQNRWGLLGKGAILMGTSYPNRTTVVLRGAFVLEAITGTPPAAPPPGVPPFQETQDGEAAKTVRERMIQHRTDPNCASCHAIMDTLGLALENFDAVGRWRDRDRFAGEAIDASGELGDGRVVRSPSELREALAARPDQFVQTMTENLMMFALGRAEEAEDMPAVRAIVRDAEAGDYRFSDLVLGVINSVPFRMSTAPGEPGSVSEASLQRAGGTP